MPVLRMPEPETQRPEEIEISQELIDHAEMALKTILPAYYPHTTPVSDTSCIEYADIKSITFDGAERLKTYDSERLKNIITALKQGIPLPPISVDRCFGGYHLLNGYHRFYACVLIGFSQIPVSVLKPRPMYVPPHARNKKYNSWPRSRRRYPLHFGLAHRPLRWTERSRGDVN